MFTWNSADKQLTATLPTTDATAGFDLSGVEAFRIIISCPSGITFDLSTGSPKILYLLFSPSRGRWMQNPNLTRTLSTSDAAGGRDIVIEDVPVFVPFGRLFVAQSGLTVSSGTVIEGLTVEAKQK